MIPEWMQILLAWITAVGSIIGFTAMCFNYLKRKLEKWIITEVITQVEKRMDKIEGWIKSQQEDIDTLFDEKLLIITSLQAVLHGMKAQGQNGPITKGITDIEQYLLNKSAKQRSKMDK